MFELKTLGLFIATAVAEIVGCYLPYLWLHKGAPAWVLLPAAAALSIFVWLLTLHPAAAGRVYAAYGGVYVATALLWLWAVDGIRPTAWDLAGGAVAIAGMAIIMFAPRPA
ncbi:MAG: YnfA family protein [Burkholderiales bacterium]|jgi:small multidrug resistance family-3 protein|nr:YnfA family protein [Burkholderiales bacterium]